MPLRFAEAATEAYRFPLTIRHLLDSAMITAADQLIVYRDQARFTYSELHTRIGRLASMLATLGVEAGTTVAVMDWDSHRYLETYFAVPMMGAVLETVNVRLPAAQITYTLRHANAQVLLVHREFFPLLEAILPSVPSVKAVVAMMDGAAGDLPAQAVGEYEALSAAALPDYPFEDFDENAVATLFYTTGTTGDPKGVCFTHRQLVLHTLAACGPFGNAQGHPGLGIDDVYMPLTPMFHVHAWGVPYIATLLGLKQVYPGRYDPELICQLHREHKVTFSHCIPTILQMVLRGADTYGADLSGWKMVIGGAALSKALFAEGRRRGLELVAGYGMSETCPTIAIARRRAGDNGEEAQAASLTSSGVPVPLVSARIVDADMNDVPHDGVSRGELVLRAPWLTPCYVGNPKASEALWHGGWMHTQDIATMDARGYIRIRDRLKDLVKTGGEWIDSIQLEELIASAEGVAEAAVIAVPDPSWGERPLAVIVPRAGATPALEALNAPVERAIAANEITRFAKLDRFVIVEQLPRTSVGKIDKKQMRAKFGMIAR
jgi:fatty-acyl-CoA synthase